ncbi:MAG: hypothetical protein JJT95_13210 [Pararhodobacter sp.]|nr:hypothetical protein [Pararhodobacter sp.]
MPTAQPLNKSGKFDQASGVGDQFFSAQGGAKNLQREDIMAEQLARASSATFAHLV